MNQKQNRPDSHSHMVRLFKSYGDKAFVQFRKSPEIKGLPYLDELIGAIEQKRVLRLTYLPFYEDRAYFNEVHPYLLKEHAYRWYLVAWNGFKEQLRTYALDRIRGLEVLGDGKYREPDFDVSDYFRYSLGIIAPPGAPALVKIALQRTQAQYLITQPWHESQNIEEDDMDNDEVVFSFRLHPTYELKSLILSMGKDARVLEPESLKQEIRQEAQLMLKAYGG